MWALCRAFRFVEQLPKLLTRNPGQTGKDVSMLAFSFRSRVPFWSEPPNCPHLPRFGSHGWAVLEKTNWLSFKWKLSGSSFPRLPLRHSSRWRKWTPQKQTRLIQNKSPWNVCILDVRSSVPAVFLYRSTPYWSTVFTDAGRQPRSTQKSGFSGNSFYCLVSRPWSFRSFQGWNSSMPWNIWIFLQSHLCLLGQQNGAKNIVCI